MLQSNQIINENAIPLVKNSVLDVQGKLRVLAFDVDFTQKETVAQEDILLVKLPKVDSRIVQIGLSIAEGVNEDTFDLVINDIQHDNINSNYDVIASKNLKTGISLNKSGGAVINLNQVISPSFESNIEKYISLKASIAFTKANVLNGYVLYIVD